ncbi:glycosyltransferase family 4 protein [Roseomonas sp. 18066]|uniref:glycosyltransferase family 4 protein n=1 Tax=Roseomonas sp. 18066 TaxID=2681412 RepID=UPI00135994ED|nr:glycosyltransferase family 4 protein [Roseomonas sp. 18066]
MTELSRIAFIGNSLPRRCGIATFTTDLQRAVAGLRPGLQAGIVAMNDHGHHYDYPAEVTLQIDDHRLQDYLHAADVLNASRVDVVSLQHEFGIFGGEAGGNIIALLSRLQMPVVTTLHTVLAAPSTAQRWALDSIAGLSARVVVMAEKGRELLRGVYGVPAERIDVIPHGIPHFAFVEPDAAKQRLGFGSKPVILTFGLLSPGKGIEVVIDAMPQILQRCPDAVYVILGASHPNLVRHEGEAYRESLVARARKAGVEASVVFVDRFVEPDTLLEYISMCDVYVTPYLDEHQMTSGTLAYSYGLGKAVVSTPYWHARELLADGGGVLVPFGDAVATGAAISGLLSDHTLRLALRKRAYAGSRAMLWPRAAEHYLAAFDRARREQAPRLVGLPAPVPIPVPAPVPAPMPAPGTSLGAVIGVAAGQEAAPPHLAGLPALRTDHLLAMCDSTGLFQHAVHAVADRAHGYCVDDNARALLLACVLGEAGERRLPDVLVGRFAAFVQHAWNPDTGRFRNFMSFDRRWLEDRGSEDSHGRTLWALGETARADVNPSRRRWAAALFAEALPAVEGFTSPRAWAFTLLGLEGYCAVAADDVAAARLRRRLADRLARLLALQATAEWCWFEDGLSYDNARLPQALLVTGMALGLAGHVEAGLRALRWLMAVQTSPAGHFRPVGSESFGDLRCPPRPFDQQPLEATAAISACLAAWRAEGGAEGRAEGRAERQDDWRLQAERAFAWFTGRNDLAVPLVDAATGSCRDGLHRDRANENRGGESVVSYLLGHVEIRQLARARPAMPTLALLA